MRPALKIAGATALVLALTLTLPVADERGGGSARAQADPALASCHKVRLQTTALPSRPIELYDSQKVYAEDLPRAQLPATLVAYECLDPKFLTLRTGAGLRLVRRTTINPPELPNIGCICPSAGGTQHLSVPGVAPWPVCSKEEPKCR
ncbi:hypothetical protein DDF62_02510 [Caulobacter radicis]|uniref:hypothetical protein n=1 Tax=Caulobacter radicis TaxID=2172650 RepID=UPI000D56D2F1|nr:hypothetical protein [Caulobacter radicis]PVM92048.1 hypothetical protein DDF62_02510 [Caulobacter radicis]